MQNPQHRSRLLLIPTFALGGVAGWLLHPTGAESSAATATVEANRKLVRKDSPDQDLSGNAAKSNDPGSPATPIFQQGVSDSERIAKILQLRNPVDRITQFSRELENLTSANAAWFIDLLARRDPTKLKMNSEWQALWTHWARVDPVQALDYAYAQAEGKAGYFAVDVMLNAWANENPQAAYAYLTAHQTSPFNETALMSYIGVSASHDIGKALQFTDDTLKDHPDLYNRSIQRIHGEYLMTNPEKGPAGFFASLPSDAARKVGFGHAYWRIATDQPPADAAAWVVENKQWASEKHVQDMVSKLNAKTPGSGTQWSSENFPQFTTQKPPPSATGDH